MSNILVCEIELPTQTFRRTETVNAAQTFINKIAIATLSFYPLFAD